MAPITPQDREMLNREYQGLDGKRRAEMILSSTIGRRLKKKEIDLIKTTVLEFVEWHEKQHPGTEKCDYCELVRLNFAMSLALEFWHTRFHSTKSAPK